MNGRWVRCAVLAGAVGIAPTAGAQEATPDLLLRRVTSDVVDIVRQSRGNFGVGRSIQMEELIDRKIGPVFDFPRMTQSAVASSWRVATPDQRTTLITEFRTLLVRTYSAAIRAYRDETFEFRTLNVAAGGNEAVVRSIVKQGGSARATIDYDMHKTPAGWQVHEIRMDGVNLIANYRPTFAARVLDGGVDALIKALTDKNRQSSYSGPRPATPQDPA